MQSFTIFALPFRYPEKCRSGRTGRSRKPLYRLAVPGVRIPLSPQPQSPFCDSKIGLFSFPLPLKIHFQEVEGMKKGRKTWSVAEGLGFGLNIPPQGS